MTTRKVSFPGTAHPPAELQDGANLSEELTVMNSPMLFGCRAGICGTCLIEVIEGSEDLPPPTGEEREALDICAPDNPRARLGCQLKLTADISLRKIRSA